MLNWGLFTQKEAEAEFWQKPDWYVLKTWGEILKRKKRDYNLAALPHTQFYAALLNNLGKKGQELEPQQFLLFPIEDDNSPAEQVKKLVRPSAIRTMKKLYAQGKIPPKVLCVLFGHKGIEQILNESSK